MNTLRYIILIILLSLPAMGAQFDVPFSQENGSGTFTRVTVSPLASSVLTFDSIKGLGTTALSSLSVGSAAVLATSRSITITGDMSWTVNFDGSGNVTAAGTLATVATAGTTGSSTAIPVVTIDVKGRVTGITTAAVVAPAGTLTGTALASNVVSSSLTSVGTIGTGVWQGTAIADGFIASALTGKTYNGLTISSTTGTLTITNGKTLSISNTITLSGTDGSTLNIGGGGTLGTAAYTASSDYVPTSRTVNGHALSLDVTVSASDVGLGSVTNDAQTKASIVPNTVPSSGQLLIGNGTAYAPQVSSGDVIIGSTGLMSIQNNKVTGAMIALGSDAQGDIMYYDGTDWVRLGAGTNGQFLKTFGTGANPAWANVSGSGVGDVTGPSSSTDGHIVQFDGTTGKLIKDGLAVSQSATASAVTQRDSNANSFNNNQVTGYTATATAGGTTTLTAASTQIQDFTGSSTQTVQMPVTSTLATGWTFIIKNHSTSSLVVNSSGGNNIGNIAAGKMASVRCILTTGTTAASWDMDWVGVDSSKSLYTFLMASGTSADLRTYLSDESGTGAAYFQGGDLGTPSAGDLSNCTQRVKAWCNFDGTTAADISTATYSRTGTTVTVTLAAHGYLVNHVIYADFTSGGALDGVYTITAVTTDTFTLTTAASGSIAGGSTMNILRRSIRASSGIHSVTYDNSAGLYHINLSTAQSDANYAIIATGGEGTAGADTVLARAPTAAPTTTSFMMKVGSTATGVANFQYVSFSVMR